MCGRYSFSTTREKIVEELDVTPDGQLTFSFNIAPTHPAYVITTENPQAMDKLNWGLLPHWSKDGKLTGKLINARIEGITTKPSFRMAIRKRRCLVLADSFYEWRKEGRKKIPYRIAPKDGKLLVLAGIWEIWKSPAGEEVRTFSILTTDANNDVNNLHNRMPLFFPNKEQQDLWLSDLSLDEVQALLRIPAPDYLTMYRVSDRLNTPINDSEELHLEVPEPPSLF